MTSHNPKCPCGYSPCMCAVAKGPAWQPFHDAMVEDSEVYKFAFATEVQLEDMALSELREWLLAHTDGGRFGARECKLLNRVLAMAERYNLAAERIAELQAFRDRAATVEKELDDILDAALTGMREPMTLDDAQHVRSMLTREVVRRKKAKVLEARAARSA